MAEEMSATTMHRAFDLVHLCRYFSELSPHPMVAVEGATCIVRHANKAFLTLAGANKSEIIGRKFAEAVPEGEANGCMALLDRVFVSGTPEFLPEQKHLDDRIPAPAYWSYTVWAILGGGGELEGGEERPVGVMIQITDSTEISHFRSQAAAVNQALLVTAVRQEELAEIRTSLNARLQEAIREKEYFIAVLSHELRTPLTPVLLASAMLARDDRLDAETREILKMIHRNITHEARLIDDLLDVTRMERGKVTLDRSPVDLRALLERTVEMSRADVETGRLTLVLDTGEEPQIVDADGGRLQQVFSNLLRNAIKFTAAGGNIRIQSRSDGDGCTVMVIDNGVGIEPEFLARAFSAFEQGDTAQARREGLGLGLAICKTIVGLHGGTISAHSEGKGRGATMVVRVPRLATVEAGGKGRDAGAAPGPVKPLRILLVEDHEDTARVMLRLLKGEGHTVQWAGDMAAGLALATNQDFDLLLSDIGLPDGTGVELMKELRAKGMPLPGIVISGYGQRQDIEASVSAGFATHLTKPINPLDLRRAISALMG